jgi:alkylhydroperoxidase/carboxymuconolactone decarboxylase family protein YurZ
MRRPAPRRDDRFWIDDAATLDAAEWEHAMSELASPDVALKILDMVKAKRGYLLPHHGLLAITAPALARAYDETYTALTLTPRALSVYEKEFVWLPILIVMDEAIATHHIAKFRAAGADSEAIETCLRLAAFARGARDFRFVESHWRDLVPGWGHERAYRAALDALTAGRGTDRGLIEAALAAAHACLTQWAELALHIRGAYAAGFSEAKLAEALSLVMFPGSVPHFVEACRVWRDLVKSGAVPASDTLKLWAAIDQSGFDGKV